MKKIICTFFAILFSASLFAELRKPSRFVEIGLDAGVGISNNYFDASDILVQNLVFDLQKIADEMPSGGLNLNASLDSNFFVNVNAKPTFRLGFFMGVDSTGNITVSKQLFELLAEGNSTSESESVKIGGYADVFLDMGVTYHTVIRDFGITITPAYYLPVAYIPETDATVSYETTSTGVVATATAPMKIYTLFDMQKFADNSFTSADIQEQLSEALGNGGFDLALAAERQVLNSLDVGVFTRVPVLPGHLDYLMTMNAQASAVVDNLLGLANDSETTETDYSTDDVTYSSASYKIYRPFRLGIEGAWRPFGAWFTFAPAVAVVVRNPYSSDAVTYPEYRFDTTLSLFNIIALSAGTAYESQIFIQRVGFMLNTHVIQLNVQASLQGADFVNSFGLGGAGVSAGVRIGF